MNPLSRLFRRRPSSTVHVAVATHVIRRPIALAEREPGDGPRDLEDDECWWGVWAVDAWLWSWGLKPCRGETHWLPASVDVLPVRCYAPEVKP